MISGAIEVDINSLNFRSEIWGQSLNQALIRFQENLLRLKKFLKGAIKV